MSHHTMQNSSSWNIFSENVWFMMRAMQVRVESMATMTHATLIKIKYPLRTHWFTLAKPFQRLTRNAESMIIKQTNRMYAISILELPELTLDNQFLMVAFLDASYYLRVDVERFRDGDDFFGMFGREVNL